MNPMTTPKGSKMAKTFMTQTDSSRTTTVQPYINDATVTVVHCWSAPRSRSTALMYSFHSRSDCAVIDEPLYRRWLAEKSNFPAKPNAPDQGGVHRPYRDMILGLAPSTSGKDRWMDEHKPLEERIQSAIATASTKAAELGAGPVVFVKHMAKQAQLYNFREEREMPWSFSHTAVSETLLQSPNASAELDSGLKGQEAAKEEDAPGVLAGGCEYSAVRHVHVLLVRDPVAVLTSWKASSQNHGNAATPDEVGIISLLAVYSSLMSLGRSPTLTLTPAAENAHATGAQSPSVALSNSEKRRLLRGPVVILDSDRIVDDPRMTLTALCRHVGIPYTEEMLAWPAGPKSCDGPWAPYWYADVHRSTGWVRSSIGVTAAAGSGGETAPPAASTAVKSYISLDQNLIPVLRSCVPAYQFLKGMDCTAALREPRAETIFEDPRNVDLLVWIGGRYDGHLIPRDMAGVSPFDSSVQGGDAVWEGLRVYNGKILSLDRHLKRLLKSAKALAFENVHTTEEITDAIFSTLAANSMRDGAHIRLTLTRGKKTTSSMNPKFNAYGTTLIVLAEWKPTLGGATTYDNENGISLITATNRRNPPSTVDSKIHHNNMINNILPKIQANQAGVDDAIMLDIEGYVSETNATNIFMVDDSGVLHTPSADHCLPGITRETVLCIARELGIPTQVRRISLAEFHYADEVFTTGTMGELTPVTNIDGRDIGPAGRVGSVTRRLQEVYSGLPGRPGWSTPIPSFS